MKRETIYNACLFGLLVAFAVAGRWLGASDRWEFLRPNFTPMAAVGLAAGFLFANRYLALAVPLVALAISNLLLESYGGLLTASAVYGTFLAAPLLGRLLRSRPSLGTGLFALTAPALLFFLTTNLAHWLEDMQHVHRMYATSCSGLATCYAAGIPFFRWMLEGDLLFCGVLFGAIGLSRAVQHFRRPLRRQPAYVRIDGCPD